MRISVTLLLSITVEGMDQEALKRLFMQHQAMGGRAGAQAPRMGQQVGGIPQMTKEQINAIEQDRQRRGCYVDIPADPDYVPYSLLKDFPELHAQYAPVFTTPSPASNPGGPTEAEWQAFQRATSQQRGQQGQYYATKNAFDGSFGLQFLTQSSLCVIGVPTAALVAMLLSGRVLSVARLFSHRNALRGNTGPLLAAI
eukprot:gnl/MRDRNA2_/MRDRNA2_31280_c0_seq1.p1 gnl/MRDRNA2_/MRDRNA2_31280_c0~~gnl/MRDRNA2_/MRDRNA2_31280_c0_seq1.p1  ORF type:complete len:198 (-),score=23.04 gnl/MRDRNA2_/MRDRNA2_31280_c0_seq1:136-729(-)